MQSANLLKSPTTPATNYTPTTTSASSQSTTPSSYASQISTKNDCPTQPSYHKPTHRYLTEQRIDYYSSSQDNQQRPSPPIPARRSFSIDTASILSSPWKNSPAKHFRFSAESFTSATSARSYYNPKSTPVCQSFLLCLSISLFVFAGCMALIMSFRAPSSPPRPVGPDQWPSMNGEYNFTNLHSSK